MNLGSTEQTLRLGLWAGFVKEVLRGELVGDRGWGRGRLGCWAASLLPLAKAGGGPCSPGACLGSVLGAGAQKAGDRPQKCKILGGGF